MRADILSRGHCGTMKAVTEANSAATMTRAAAIMWSKKNTGDHEKFSAIWANHNIIAALEDPRSHVLDPAMAIRTNRTVQTGANIQSGGLKGGFCKFAYHWPGAFRYPIVIPAPRTTAMNATERSALTLKGID